MTLGPVKSNCTSSQCVEQDGAPTKAQSLDLSGVGPRGRGSLAQGANPGVDASFQTLVQQGALKERGKTLQAQGRAPFIARHCNRSRGPSGRFLSLGFPMNALDPGRLPWAESCDPLGRYPLGTFLHARRFRCAANRSGRGGPCVATGLCEPGSQTVGRPSGEQPQRTGHHESKSPAACPHRVKGSKLIRIYSAAIRRQTSSTLARLLKALMRK